MSNLFIRLFHYCYTLFKIFLLFFFCFFTHYTFFVAYALWKSVLIVRSISFDSQILLCKTSFIVCELFIYYNWLIVLYEYVYIVLFLTHTSTSLYCLHVRCWIWTSIRITIIFSILYAWFADMLFALYRVYFSQNILLTSCSFL